MITQLGIEQLKPSPERLRQGYPIVSVPLLEAIQRYGVTEPVPVRPLGHHEFEMISGEETWLAVQQLGQRSLPAYINDRIDAEGVIALIRSRHRSIRSQRQRDSLGGSAWIINGSPLTALL